MTDQDQHSSPAPSASSQAEQPRKRPRPVVLMAVLIGVVLLGAGGVVAYQLSGSPRDDDSGVTACRSAGVVVRTDRGEEVTPAELKRVGELFQSSGHEDLKSTGVLAIGLAQRVQRTRGADDPGAALYRDRLREALPRLAAACKEHGVTVKA
ncbi:hypothetical protein [Micromonospora sp. DT47]|uniref:hypothetical protein n=1 Tax=Micromonospora sp. DT47 TaxID=3393431 RepID=UPI003CEC4200